MSGAVILISITAPGASWSPLKSFVAFARRLRTRSFFVLERAAAAVALARSPCRRRGRLQPQGVHERVVGEREPVVGDPRRLHAPVRVPAVAVLVDAVLRPVPRARLDRGIEVVAVGGRDGRRRRRGRRCPCPSSPRRSRSPGCHRGRGGSTALLSLQSTSWAAPSPSSSRTVRLRPAASQSASMLSLPVADDGVVAGAARDGVDLTVARQDGVVAVAARQVVGSGATVELVVAARTVERVPPPKPAVGSARLSR